MSGIDPNIVDRLVDYFSPVAGHRRAAARASIEMLRRGYDGASKGGRFGAWRAAQTSADAETAASLSILRGRMRDLVRNNPVAAKAVQVLTDGLVGTGIRPRAMTGDKKLDALVNELFTEWAATCDIDGRTDFYGLQALAVRGMVEAGEMFGLRRRTRDRQGVPLKIELREPEHLDEAQVKPQGPGRVVQGIEFDASGRRVGYWMFPEHPGAPITTVAPLMAERVGADQVVHLFERQRMQNRGVPWGAPVMRSIREIDEWQEAELVRKRTEACLVGIVFNDDETAPGVNPSVVDSAGAMVEQFRPGMLAYSRGATDVKFNNPSAVGGVYEWHQVQMHIISAGFRVPYELLTGDLSRVNFSSSRVGMNAYRRMIEAMQWQIVIPAFCQPIWQWFVDAAFAAGRIPTNTVPVEWDPPKFDSVNPLQDAQADLLEVRAGFASLQQVIAKRGYDPEAVLKEQAIALGWADDLKLVLDSDPRRVAQAGTFQPTQPDGEQPKP